MMPTGSKSEWQRGWHFVALTVLGLLFAPTTVAPYTIGLFVAPLQAAYGWSHGAIEAAILFSTGFGLVGGPLAGWLVRRFGIRRAILSGVLGIGLALALVPTLQGALWQFYLFYALIALLGSGASAVTWSCLIAERFTASRGLALGVALSGTGLSAILTPRLAEVGLELGGWRVAYLALAAFPIIVTLPACLLLLPHVARGDSATDATESGHDSIDLADAIRGRHFWLIGMSTAAIYLAVGGIIPNLVPAITAKGLSRADAVSIMSVLGGAIVVGRLTVGAAIDCFWAPAVATAVLLPAAVACLILTSNASILMYVAAVAMLGAATGMEFDMLGYLVARYFGLRDYARIYGRLYTFLAVAAGGAPFAFGALYDQLRSYQAAFVVSAFLLVAGAAGLLLLGRYPDRSTTCSATGIRNSSAP